MRKGAGINLLVILLASTKKMYKTIATIMVVLATEMSVAQPHQDKLASYSLNKQDIVDEGPTYYKLSFCRL
jgi:hypothetical protein